MIILPDRSDGSRTELDNAISDPSFITMLILGKEENQESVSRKAEVRERAMPSTRVVVWAQDLGLLSGEERAKYTNSDSAVACVLDLDDHPCAWLSSDEANSFKNLERAFLLGQLGGAP